MVRTKPVPGLESRGDSGPLYFVESACSSNGDLLPRPIPTNQSLPHRLWGLLFHGKAQKTIALFLSIVILISPISPLVSASSFTDTADADFAYGAHNNTENVNDTVRLTSGNTQGTFTSQALDEGNGLIRGWENLIWTEDEPTSFHQENDNAGSEPDPLIDGAGRKGAVVGGSLASTCTDDGVYEEIGEDVTDNTLNWAENIENVTAGFDNYTVKIKGYTSVDAENVGVYIWENQDGAWGWRFLDNLTDTERTIAFTVSGDNIENYLVGENIGVRYLEDTADLDQTIVHIDLCIVEENVTYESEVKLQVRTSADNSTWGDWKGPDNTSGSYFTNGAGMGYSTVTVGMENIPDNRYIQYIAYFSSGTAALSGADGPILYDVTVNYTNIQPTLQTPSNGSYDNDNTPTFDWADVDGVTNYWLWVDNDSNFLSCEIKESSLTASEYTPTTGLADKLYSWKVKAKVSSDLVSLWSGTWTFTIDTVTPSATTILSPDNNVTLVDDQPLFTWTTVSGSGLTYKFEIDNDSDFSSPIYFKTGITENYCEIENKLPENFQPYYWKVAAADNAGNENWSGWYKFLLRVPPYSSVSALSPYWDNDAPRTITVTAGDNDGLVDNVELWYRYSADNAGWGNWIKFENKKTSPYTFNFTFDNGNGYYEFYSRTWDDRGNYENAPSAADAICGHDNAVPNIPTLLTPENNMIVQTQTLTFTWTSVSSLSPVRYDLAVDNENSFTAPYVYYKTGISGNSHLTENSFGIGTYYWKVKTNDNAGNENIWSENFTLTISVWHSIETWTGPVSSPPATGWYKIENWAGTTVAPNRWNLINSWIGYGSSGGVWTKFETWVGAVAVPAVGWHVIETWNGTAFTTVQWRTVELWSGTAAANVQWRTIEMWTGAANAAVVWHKVETWAGTVTSPTTIGWYSVEKWFGSVGAQIPTPTLVSPTDGTNTSDTTPFLDWDNAQAADNFQIQIDNESSFTSPYIYFKSGVTTDNHEVENALADNQYYWRVRAFRNNENSAWSENWRVRVDTVIPAKPTLAWPADGENVNDNTLNFDWDATPENSYPLMYNVQIATDKYFENIVQTAWVADDNWNLTTSLADNSYYWRVRVRDNAGNSGQYSDRRAFRIDILPPVAPSLASPENNGWTGENATLTWGTVSENSLPVLYNLVVAESSDFTSVVVNVWTENTSWTGTLEEYSYWWHVRAKDNAGNVGDNSANRKFTIDNVLPATVVLYAPENNARCQTGAIAFEWHNATDGDSGIARYWIQIDDESNFSDPRIYENTNVMENTCTYTISDNVIYYWRVLAVDNAGNLGVWSGNYRLITCRWQTIETWGGTITAPLSTRWIAVESWAGTITTTAGWHAVEGWAGNVSFSGIVWRTVESWTGNVGTAPAWRSIESWTGTVNVTSQAWTRIESWTGTVNVTSQAWTRIESWTGTVNVTSQAWTRIESWTSGTVNVTSQAWTKIEGWTGTVNVTSQAWTKIEGWTGTVNATTSIWRSIESWSGAVSTTAPAWRTIEGWTSGTVGVTPTLWRKIEGWTGTVNATTSIWRSIESWSGAVSTTAPAWRTIESWTGTVNVTASVWKSIESWNGTVGTATLAWMVIEGWSGVMSASLLKGWYVVESRTGTITAAVQWRFVETWSGTVTTSAQWRFVETWSGTVTTSAQWRFVETWSATANAPSTSGWRAIESWSDTVTSPAKAGWITIETWTGTASAPTTTPTLVSPANGTNTSDTTPFLDWDNAQAADNFQIQIDNESSFTSPYIYFKSGVTTDNHDVENALADNQYYWRVRAFRNNENSAWSENWRVRVDTVAPANPTAVSPANGENINDNTPLLKWQAPTENSYPLLYWVQVDNEDAFNVPYVAESDWVSNENWEVTPSLADNVYYWRVKTKDNAGNLSVGWCSSRSFRVDTLVPAVPTPLSPIGGTWTTNSPNLDWASVSDNSLPVRYRVWACESSGFAGPYTLYDSGWITSDNWVVSLPATTGKIYYWKVGSKDNAGNLSENSSTENFRVDVTYPLGVQLLTPENNSCFQPTAVTFEWENSVESGSGVAHYHLQIDNEDNFSAPLIYENENITENTYTYSIPNTGTYYWRVMATDNVGYQSDWSDTYQFTRCVWRTIETWTGSASSSAHWRVIESWTTDNYVSSYVATKGTVRNFANEQSAGDDAYSILYERGRELIKAYDNRNTTTESTASTTFTDLTGSSVTVSASENSYLLIDFHAALSSNSTGDNVEFRVLVGSTEVAKGKITEPGANLDTTVSLTRAYRVASGNYTVKAQWRRAYGLGTLSCWEKSINVAVVPETLMSVYDNMDNTTNSTTSTAFIDMTGPFLSVNADESSYLLIDFDSTFNSNTTGDNVEFRVLVDGAEVAKGRSTLSSANLGIHPSLTRAYRVDSGTHVVKAQWRVIGWGPINSWEKSLNVAVVPERLFPVYDNRDNTTENTTSTTFVDLTGPSLSVTTNENAYLFIDFHAVFDSSTSGDATEFKILVDGTEVAKGYTEMPAAGVDTTISLTREYRVTTTGTHTVKVQWRSAGGSGTPSCWEKSLNVAVVSNFYDMEIAENINSLPFGHEYYLETRYMLSNENDQFRIQVWDGATWDNCGDNLRQTSWTDWSYQLQSDEVIGGENVRVKFIDVNPNTDNSCDLYVDYLKVRIVKSGWTCNVSTAPVWRKVEGWTVTVGAPSLTGWVKIENWGGSVSAPRHWFIIESRTGTVGAPVPKPVLSSPGNGTGSTSSTPTFSWENAQVADNYQIQIDNNSDFSSPENECYLTENQYTPPALPDNLYYWRVIAWRNGENSGWSENWTVLIDTLPPGAPTVVSPDNGVWTDTRPNLDWNPVSENSLPVVYYVAISDNENFPYENENSGWITSDNWLVRPLSENVDNYFWRVKAKDALNQSSAWSENRWFKVDNTPTTKVENLSPENNIYHPVGVAFSFTWDNATDTKSGVARYHIQIDNENSFSAPLVHENDNITENTYTYTLAVGTYYWRVSAIDNVGNQGAWSDNFCLTISTWRKIEGWTGTVGAPIPAPVLLLPENGTNTTNTTPLFDWENTQAADDFTFQLDNDNNFSPVVLEVTIADSDYTPAPLGDNLYYWRVRMTRGGQIGSWSEKRTVRIDTLNPSAPTLTSPENGIWTTATPNLDWSAVSENSQPVSYYVAISDNSEFPYENENSGWITSDNWVVSPALPDGIWYWRVTDKDNAGNPDGWSENRAIRVDGTPPTPITLLSPENNTENTIGSSTTVTFRWASATDSGSGLARYWIQLDNDNDFSSASLENLTDNSRPWTLTPGTYYWRVMATDNVGNQDNWSDGFKLILRRWVKIEGWTSGLVRAPATGWRKIEGWTSGTTRALASWRTVDTWQVTTVGYATWRLVQSWTGTVQHTASWRLIETRTGTVKDLVTRLWYKIDARSGSANSPHGWAKVERWGASGGAGWPGEPSGPSTPVENNEPTVQAGTVGWFTAVEGEARPFEWGLVDSLRGTARAVQTLAGTVVTIGHMVPGASSTADFSAENLSVVGVSFAIKSDASAGTIGTVMISVDENTTIPDGTQAPSGVIYRYFGVDTSGVPSQNISQAVITIKVEKSWVESEKIDLNTIRVLRLGVDWGELTTEKSSEDETYYYFNAYSPGFSLFAVIGQLKVETPAIVTPIQIVPPAVTTGPTQMRPPVELFAAIGAVGVAVGFMAYRRSSSFRYNSMLKQFKSVSSEPMYSRLQPKLAKIRRKVKGSGKASLMRTASSLWKPTVPGMVPVRERLTGPELLAVRRLEKFIEQRRGKAPTVLPVKKKKLEKIRRRMVTDEVALKRLEKFVEQRRAVAKIPKRKKPKK